MFHRPSFSAIAFNPVSFGGQKKQDGRSGYWRLFFTQLQEESDKSRDEQGKPSVVEIQPKPSPKTAKEKPQKRVIRPPEVVEKAPPFRPLPMHQAKPDEPTYLQQMWDITLELREMVASLQLSAVKFNQQLDARNDEDDIELLLLVI